ncbi:MAG: PspC protein [Firmicutes bacterium]|nr:PspC protein [Bacillota bacterium]
MNKKLYRSYSNRMVCGVCGGIGEFFHIDPTVIRLIWAVLSIPGPGIIAYILAAIIIPTEN